MKVRRTKRLQRARAAEAKAAAKVVCPNCGRPGRHYCPPSLGDPGFYACDAFKDK